jgi:predicted RNase H-like HicB family nuclease
MARGLIVVKAAYDADAAVWFVESSELEGVNAEAPSLDELLQKLPGVIVDFLEEEGFDDAEVPIELVAHARTRARRGSAAS